MSPRPAAWARATAIAPLLATACTIPTSTSSYGPAPARQPLAFAGSVPADGTPGVPLGAAITLLFSGFPDPSSVSSFGPIAIRSGPNSFDFTASVDLVSSAILLRPRTPLSPNTQYAVIVSHVLRGLDGSYLPADRWVRFTTGTSPDGGTPPPAPRSLSIDVEPVFQASCALGNCHDAAGRMSGLDLSSAEAAAASLIGQGSAESPLQRVAPGSAASSYLLRKLLATPDIVGDPMPPGGPLSVDELHVLGDWITRGAAP
jgi:hypothetical protein